MDKLTDTWFCYILRNNYEPHKNITYNGSTNNLVRRIRQHNGIISGGARLTHKYGNSNWSIYALVSGFPDHVNCLQCEWRIKHPDNKRKRSKKYTGPFGRIIGLIDVLQSDKWTSNSTVGNDSLVINVWVHVDCEHLFTGIVLPVNTRVNFVDDLFFEYNVR